jgi:putative transcriptional regulator
MKQKIIDTEKVARAIEADAGQALDGLRTSLNEMKAHQAGKAVHVRQTQVQVSPVIEARNTAGFTQKTFAQLLGVSLRTLQDWEQGRRNPSKAAQTLLKIATKHPEALQDLQGA